MRIIWWQHIFKGTRPIFKRSKYILVKVGFHITISVSVLIKLLHIFSEIKNMLKVAADGGHKEAMKALQEMFPN